jgi:hypothetical protein
MTAAAALVIRFYPNEWRQVEARVVATKIESFRTGGPKWALLVDLAYVVSGEPMQAKGIRITQDIDRAVMIALQDKWPTGRTLQIYYDANNPSHASLSADGGREAMAVVAILLTPIVVGLVLFVALVIRRSRQAATKEKLG